MKKIVFSLGIATFLTATGCVVAPVGERHGYYRPHPRYEGRSEVIIGPPPVLVRPPEIIVR